MFFLILLNACQGTRKAMDAFQPTAKKIEMNYACLQDTLPLVTVSSKEAFNNLQAFFDESDDSCFVELPEISFDTATLVLYHMTSGGCKVSSSFSSKQSDLSKSINFLITVEQEGFCKKLHLESGMYIVGKPSKEYTVKAGIVKKEPGGDKIFPGI
jgi:hypothetical protein